LPWAASSSLATVRLLINDKLLSILDIVTFLEVEILNWRKEKKKIVD
jgi:hypothetical protein